MKIKLFFAAIFISAFFAGIFPNVCLAGSADGNLLLKNIYVSKSKNADSYLIWFKFNRKPENIVKKLGLNGYSLELAFKNAQSGMGAKFVKFHNSRLFKAVEIIPAENSELNAVIYFHKNIKIARKDTYATFYGNYFIIKINHIFSGDLFKNVGKELPAQKNKIKPAVKVSKQPARPAGVAAAPSASPSSSHGSPASPAPADSFFAKSRPKLNMGLEAVKTAVYLAFIIGLIYGAYFLMNKLKNRISLKEKPNNLKIVSSINLGNKKSILLIEVNKEFFLVGVSQSNIQVIGQLKGEAVYKTAAGKGAPGGALSADAVNADAAADAVIDTDTNTYEILKAGTYGSGAPAPSEDAPSASRSRSFNVKSYGKFADVMREQVNNANNNVNNNVNNAGGVINEPYRKIKNINEAKFKNKADNVFFDIEERLKGLMESNGNSKKF